MGLMALVRQHCHRFPPRCRLSHGRLLDAAKHQEGPTTYSGKDQSLTTDGVARHSVVLNETRHSVLLTKEN
jgi:hypothetical protein